MKRLLTYLASVFRRNGAVVKQPFSVSDLHSNLRQSKEFLIEELKRIGVNADDIKEPPLDLDEEVLACVCAADFFLEPKQKCDFDQHKGVRRFLDVLISIRMWMEKYDVEFLVVPSKPFGTEFVYKPNEWEFRLQRSEQRNRVMSKKNEKIIEYAS